MCDSDLEEVEYELEDFVLGGQSLSVTTIAYLPITTLMNNRTADKEISGQKLWCGSLCVVNYLFQHADYVPGFDVIELGAGTAVVSMIAKRLGAVHVFATDHDPLSINHMLEDFPRNHTDIQVVTLDWLQPDYGVLFSSLAQKCSSTGLKLLAGDVLYKAFLLEPFFTTVQALLQTYHEQYSEHKAELLLCHIPRAGVTQDMVQDKAREKHLQCLPIPREEWGVGQVFEYCPQEDLDRAQVYRVFI